MDGWNEETEEGFSHFVETLFAGDEDQDSWLNLQTLLPDPQRNVLFNRLGQNEDERLSLRPYCGDLAYVLRSYFAWKHGLPFRYLRCTRASSPECHVAGDNSMNTVIPWVTKSSASRTGWLLLAMTSTE